MKPASPLIILVTAFVLAVVPLHLRAADVPDACAAPAPADAGTVIRQIELKVALAQYEKVLMALPEARLNEALAEVASDEQKKQAYRESMRIKILEDMRARFRDEITRLVEEINADAVARAGRDSSKDQKSK